MKNTPEELCFFSLSSQPLPTSQFTSVHYSGLFSTVGITSYYDANIAAPINFKLSWDFQLSGKIPKN